jgi:acyl carrier protein
MDEIAATTFTVLKAHLRGPGQYIDYETRLNALGVEALDMAMVVLDIEDMLAIDFPFDPEEDADAFETVAALVERVRLLVKSKACRPQTAIMATNITRTKSLWVRSSSRA